MDYHICSDIGLVVSEANQDLSDLSKRLVKALESATGLNAICGRKFNNSPERMPFFHYISQTDVPANLRGGNQGGHAEPE